MTDAPAHVLRARRYVAAHLGDDLDLTRVAEEIGVSKYHLHHGFSAHFGVPLGRYVRLLRLERAAHQLAFRQDPVLDIALGAGFAGAESFARAFGQTVGMSPSAFRAQPDWPTLRQALMPLYRVPPPPPVTRFDVSVVESPDIRLVTMPHRGPPASLGETLRRFIAWRRSAGLHPARWDTYNVLFTPADIEPVAAFRLDVGTVSPQAIGDNGEGLEDRVVPAGRYAVLMVRGDDSALGPAFDHLYGPWLASAGHRLAPHPPLLRRVTFFPDVPAPEALTELRLMLAD